MVYLCVKNDYPLTLIKEKEDSYGKKKSPLQMDKILKRLFTLKTRYLLTDFLIENKNIILYN
ncbi:hypothetical protein [Clostridium magnum]|uniref:Uncharacterized protein n=1 Tax=Clostridium magnum DSM 2767 TaxID=1121326 RepID=A0A162QII2_9CLOT|nr:hypothetical protein [Clostridium magnum]KZL88569.1 hypothetical protein CLMAG_60620 [Clostridium magnum DSM 2767]SHI82906.1 hypothetical protein SAMN02745944_04917 [Clostridium magnum DSM 2767]